MAVTRAELTDFQVFAEQQLGEQGAESLEEMVGLGRLANRTPAEAADDLEAIRRGADDADAGRTLPVDQAFDEVRSALRTQQ